MYSFLGVFVAAGDRIDYEDNILTLRNRQVALDIPSPRAVSCSRFISASVMLLTKASC